MALTRASLGPTTVLEITDDGGWNIRILHPVAQAIHADALRWGSLETGGALVGRISFENRTITVAGIVDAPPDSVERLPALFSARMDLFGICVRPMRPLWGISLSSELGIVTRMVVCIRVSTARRCAVSQRMRAVFLPCHWYGHLRDSGVRWIAGRGKCR